MNEQNQKSKINQVEKLIKFLIFDKTWKFPVTPKNWIYCELFSRPKEVKFILSD